MIGTDYRRGLGLGLYISRQIVELHGGEIRAEFPADGGTRLTFALDAKVGGLAGLFMGGMVQKTMDSEVKAIERLKAILEGQPNQAAGTAQSAAD